MTAWSPNHWTTGISQRHCSEQNSWLIFWQRLETSWALCLACRQRGLSLWSGRAGLAQSSAPSASLYLEGQGGVVQDDIPLHHHLRLVGDLAHGCGPDHVVRLQVLLVLSICDLYRVLYFWKKKPGSRVREGGVGF